MAYFLGGRSTGMVVSEMSKTIMILGAGPRQLDAIYRAKEMGLTVVALDEDAHAVGLKKADHAEVISTIDIPRIIGAVLRYHADAIMSVGSETSLRSAAIVAESVGLSTCIRRDLISKLPHKGALKNILRDTSTPSPDFEEVYSYQDIEGAIERIGFPAVIKCSDKHGQRGVFKILDSRSLSEAVKRLKSISKKGPILIEQFIEGPEISVHSFSSNGSVKIVAITDRIPHAPFPYLGIIHRHIFPSSLPREKKGKVKQLVRETLNTLRIENGPTYFQIIYSSDGPKIIEVSCKLDGCHMWKLIKKVIGVDLLQEAINLYLGKEVNLPNMPTEDDSIKAGILEFIEAKPYSKISTITGFEEAMAVDQTDDITLYFSEGQQIGSSHGILEKIGYIITVADNKESAIKSIEKTKGILEVNFK